MALGVVRDDGNLREKRRECLGAGRVQGECRRVAARHRDGCRERRRGPRHAGAALDVNRRAAGPLGRRDERVESSSAAGFRDPAHALLSGIRRESLFEKRQRRRLGRRRGLPGGGLRLSSGLGELLLEAPEPHLVVEGGELLRGLPRDRADPEVLEELVRRRRERAVAADRREGL